MVILHLIGKLISAIEGLCYDFIYVKPIQKNIENELFMKPFRKNKVYKYI